MLQFRERFPPPPLENEDATPLKPSDVSDLRRPTHDSSIHRQVAEYRQV